MPEPRQEEAPEYDYDESTSEQGGEFDPSQYDGQGSEDIEETGETHQPEDYDPEEDDVDDEEDDA